jgi:hypothetical protein
MLQLPKKNASLQNRFTNKTFPCFWIALQLLPTNTKEENVKINNKQTASSKYSESTCNVRYFICFSKDCVQFPFTRQNIQELWNAFPSLSEIASILDYEWRKINNSIKSNTEYLMKVFGVCLLSLVFSPIIKPYYVVATLAGLHRLAKLNKIYMDMTWFQKEHGIIAMSEKFYYAGQNKKGRLVKGLRLITHLYVYTHQRDSVTLRGIFSTIKEKIRSNFGIDWNPSFFCIDFDLASVAAIRYILPTTIIRFCYFHLKQAIRKRSVKIFGKKVASIVWC